MGGEIRQTGKKKKKEFSYSAVNKTEELVFTKRKHPQALINRLVSLCVRRVNQRTILIRLCNAYDGKKSIICHMVSFH